MLWKKIESWLTKKREIGGKRLRTSGVDYYSVNYYVSFSIVIGNFPLAVAMDTDFNCELEYLGGP